MPDQPSRLHHPVRTLGDLVLRAAALAPSAPAVEHRNSVLDYASLAEGCLAAARGLRAHHLQDGERVAIYLPKRIETVLAFFGTALARGVFVPVNPLLKPEQVVHILRDAQASVLLTSTDRACLLADRLLDCPDLRHLVLVEGPPGACDGLPNVVPWAELIQGPASKTGLPRALDADLAAILYTSGSTGRPKGVVLTHRNMVAGAESVAEYLDNRPSDRLLAVLPFSFDYGFSQLSTAFLSGASVVLMDYLLPRDVVQQVAEAGITGLAAVPPLWIQLSRLAWPAAARQSLRYITSSGGRMPRPALDRLRAALPDTEVFLMYGLTEAFRSTYLPPTELDRRPESIGRAIPNAEIVVLREDGSPCAPGEPGELVHRGALVARGYWRDPQRSAERFRPLPLSRADAGPGEIAVFSGDLVRMDEDGYLYFVGRRDDMIKTSGYRVSPTEIEEVLYATGRVSEAAAFGVPHPVLGQAIVVVAVPPARETLDAEALLAACKRQLPGFMVPAHIAHHHALPRNPNGKIDRRRLAADFQDLFGTDSP